MHVLGEIDGRTVDIDAFLDQLKDETSREVTGRLLHMLESVECAQCRWHHRDAEIVLTGTTLRELSVDIVACCDECADLVDRTVNTELRSRTSGSWTRPWTKIRAIYS
jgi:hypothetical protein